MASKKCKFQPAWLDDPQFKLWLTSDAESKHNAACRFCKTCFSLGNMGVGALKKHAEGKKHRSIVTPLATAAQGTISFVPKSNSLSSTKETAQTEQNRNDSSKEIEIIRSADSESLKEKMFVDRFFNSKDVIKAEIIWALSRVKSHLSSRASEHSVELFPVMFHDSAIAAKFQMKKDKVAYVITFGLAPYFQSELIRKLNKATMFAISIDESLNKISCKAQMDVLIRFWDLEDKKLLTRYLTSVFPIKCDAATLLKTLTDTLNELNINMLKIIQLSMDGPNVNLSLFRQFREFLQQDAGSIPKLLDVGTCPIHIVHGAFRFAHNKTGWNVIDFLRKSYFLFKDFPTRRADYVRITKNEDVPLKFCSVRWLENVPVLKRGIKVLDALKKYVNEAEKPPKDSRNFEFVKKVLTADELLEAKLHFLVTIAEECHPFLLKFQTNNAVFPFLFHELERVVRVIGEKFLKKVLFDPQIDPKNIKADSDIEIGFGAINALKKKKMSTILSFKADCRKFLQTMFVKLVSKCPLTNPVVKGASALSPQIMISKNVDRRKSRITSLLNEFVSHTILEPSTADRIKREYLNICEHNLIKEYLKKFNEEYELDSFLLKMNDIIPLSSDFIDFLKTVLIFFPSNAAVERSFSVNKECLIENLLDDSLIAQRIAYDAVKEVDLTKLEISPSMIQYFKQASSKRQESLKMKKQKEDDNNNERKRLNQELLVLQVKKQKLEETKEKELEMLEANIGYLKNKLKE